LTILVTCTAALVYLQSRFVEKPDGRTIEEHQIFALANKFVATTASIVAAAIGFAALAVSNIRPIREMGLWVAAGLLLTWAVVFTLFPALQRVCATPVLERRTSAGRRLLRVIDALPLWSYRYRWVLLPASALIMLAGVAALFGVPGYIAPMDLETDALDYIDRELPIYKDTRRFEQAISGLSAIQVWVTAPQGRVLDPAILRGLEVFTRGLEGDARVGSVIGPTTLMRWTSYVGGGGDRLPDDPAAWPALAGQLESLLLQEPALRGYIDVGTLSHARLTIVHRGTAFEDVEALRAFVGERWIGAGAAEPALAECRMRLAGEGLLQAKIARYLVPTLTESFVLTAAIIFVAFLVVFRSGAARLMAMIPSVFAILAMFVVMRFCSIPLNVATILIASTVLGASENDQIHFFYHFQEKRDGGTTEQALRHALLVAGRAILFATLINAGGFLALALSELPPMRQFGIISASAFVLSMLASLTALPAALWVFFREKPDSISGSPTAGPRTTSPPAPHTERMSPPRD
jgi:predicted RND superfamily exporter protein